MKRVVLPIVILLAGAFIAAFMVLNPAEIDEVAPEIVPVAVRVTEVQLVSTQLTVTSQGKVQAARSASLSAPVAGPVAWISPAMEAGGYVESGQELIRLDSSDFETARDRSRANRMQARAESDHADRELVRLEELAGQRLASVSQLQNAQRAAEVNRARLAEAEAGYRQAQLDLERSRIKAPFNAIVESRNVELGQYVNRAQIVALLYDADEVEVRVPLAIRQLAYLDIPLGQRGELAGEAAPKVTLRGYYGGREHRWQGRLVRIEAAIDPNSNTVQTIIRVRQPEQGIDQGARPVIPLPIGLFVEAGIEGRQVDNLISLPRSVVRNNNQVLVVDAENKMHFRDVEVYRLEQDRVLISGGLLPGERICTSPIQAVTNGMSVQPVAELMQPGAGRAPGVVEAGNRGSL